MMQHSAGSDTSDATPDSPTTVISDDGTHWNEHPACPTLVSAVAAFQHLTQQGDLEQRGAHPPPPLFPMLLHAAVTIPTPPLATLRALISRPDAFANLPAMRDSIRTAVQYLQFTAVHRLVDEGLAALEAVASYSESSARGIGDVLSFFAVAAYPGAENLVRLLDSMPGLSDQEAHRLQLRVLRLLRRTLSWEDCGLHSRWVAAVVRADVMPVLVELVKHPDTEIQMEAIETFCALMTSISEDTTRDAAVDDTLTSSLHDDESWTGGLIAIARNHVLPVRARRLAIEGLQAATLLVSDSDVVREIARVILDIAEAAHPPSVVNGQWDKFQKSLVDSVAACLNSGAAGVETLLVRYCGVLCRFGSDLLDFCFFVDGVLEGNSKLDASKSGVRSAIVAALLMLLRDAQRDLYEVGLSLRYAICADPDRLCLNHTGPDVPAALLDIIKTSIARDERRAIAAADCLCDSLLRASTAEARHIIASCGAVPILVQAVLATYDTLDENVFLWLLLRVAVSRFAEDVRRVDAALGLPLKSALATARDSVSAADVDRAVFGEEDAQQAKETD